MDKGLDNLRAELAVQRNIRDCFLDPAIVFTLLGIGGAECAFTGDFLGHGFGLLAMLVLGAAPAVPLYNCVGYKNEEIENLKDEIKRVEASQVR